MAARPIGSGIISFGLVSIPVKLYSTTKASGKRISFNLLHKDCGGRLKQQYICTKDKQIVNRDQMIKGYEFAKDQYVAFSEEELDSLAAESSDAIEITEFVPFSAVDPVYFDKPYYLSPDKGGARAYQLMSHALAESQLCAIAKYSVRGKQNLVMLRPIQQGLAMHQLHYQTEVRDFAEVPNDTSANVNPQELRLALQLIEQTKKETFDPAAYHDEVRERIAAAIEQKVEGQEITLSAPAEPKAQVIDLMEALKASLAAQPKAATAKAAASETAAQASRKPPRRAARTSDRTRAAKPKAKTS